MGQGHIASLLQKLLEAKPLFPTKTQINKFNKSMNLTNIKLLDINLATHDFINFREFAQTNIFT